MLPNVGYKTSVTKMEYQIYSFYNQETINGKTKKKEGQMKYIKDNDQVSAKGYIKSDKIKVKIDKAVMEKGGNIAYYLTIKRKLPNKQIVQNKIIVDQDQLLQIVKNDKYSL